MSDEIVKEDEVVVEADNSSTENVDAPVEEFDKEAAIEESTMFLKDLLLTDPQTQESLFVATNVQMNDDGSVSIVCVSDIESEKAVMHTIFSGYVDKQKPADDGTVDVDFEELAESNIISSPTAGKLVDLEGNPLT